MPSNFAPIPAGISKEGFDILYVYSSDFREVSELHTDFFELGGEINQEELKQLLSELSKNNTAMIGVYNHSKLVGVANLQIVEKVHYQDKKPLLLKTAQIDNVIIHKNYRGKGLGKYLIKSVCEIARKSGCFSASLYCNNYNVAFYEKCDFRHSSNHMRKTL